MRDEELIAAALTWRERRHRINATTYTMENSILEHIEASNELYDAVNEYALERGLGATYDTDIEEVAAF